MTRDSEECQGASYHSPLPLWTDRHHVIPKYLSALLGQPIDPRTVSLCATEHVNIHHAIVHLINEGSQGEHRFSARTQSYIDAAWTWWQGAVNR